MITFKNVSKSYEDGTTAVDSISFDINKGEFFVLIGPSGCGKTTTLKMMNRLIPISDGTILINGKRISDYNINELRWNIGYVLQQIALFPHMSIEENIAVVPEMKGWSGEKIRDRVSELLEMVGLDPATYRSRKPSELSGGEQQRVGVVRALAADPDIILMDEPFSALDPISREKLQDDIIHLQKNIQKTIVFVTHDMQEAVKLADRICIMRDGKIVQIGTPEEIMNNPASEFVYDFIGTSKRAGAGFELGNFMQPYSGQQDPSASIVPVTATLEEVVKQLSIHEQLHVERDGIIIGTINRQMIVQYFSQHLEKRGTAHA
ncbi:ABC transporter ATP-binding protein [Bacillus sp. FJAT-27251]|uniref:ABC transporter ATP-binding protein n=1 Tax=Bacillus sp. FJAT-27251 TaxID=1684142 RepID=UPI0006A791A6|nr:ABC transporter ATP-binding protein [Bacillus sp. FJAT-27251]